MEHRRRARQAALLSPASAADAAAAPPLPASHAGSHGGADVQVEGSFDRWTKRHAMQKSGKDYTIIQLLPPGVYQYKFIVDGQWRHDPNLPSMYDEMGNVNNVMEVQEYTPEYLGGLSGFDPPPSPPHRCKPADSARRWPASARCRPAPRPCAPAADWRSCGPAAPPLCRHAATTARRRRRRTF